MASGGIRLGAGRKLKLEKYKADINKAEKRIKDKLPEIVDAQIGLALGVTVQEFNPVTKSEEIYTTIPDRAAGQYLINRIMGAPIQKQEVTGKDGQPLTFRFVNDWRGLPDGSGNEE